MNRRRFLTSVPVLAGWGVVAAFFGRLLGAGKGKAFSAGRLRREPELMAGGDADLMASWEEGLQVDREKGIPYTPDGTVEWHTGPVSSGYIVPLNDPDEWSPWTTDEVT